MAIFPDGRRWFVTASWAAVLVSLLHTLGNTLSTPPTDANYTTLEQTMRGYTVPLGLGMAPSMWDINQSLVFTMSICLAAMGLLGVAIGTANDATSRLVRPAAVILAIASAALTALYYVYQVTPALVSMAVVTLLFVAAIAESGRADPRVWR
jgi:hypothetical protein